MRSIFTTFLIAFFIASAIHCCARKCEADPEFEALIQPAPPTPSEQTSDQPEVILLTHDDRGPYGSKAMLAPQPSETTTPGIIWQ